MTVGNALRPLQGQLHEAVRKVSLEVDPAARERGAREEMYNGYARDLGEIFGCRTALSETRTMSGIPDIEIYLEGARDSKEIIDALIPIRAEAGLSKEAMPLGSRGDRCIGISAFNMVEHDRLNDTGSLVAKLRTVQGKIRGVVSPEIGHHDTGMGI